MCIDTYSPSNICVLPLSPALIRVAFSDKYGTSTRAPDRSRGIDLCYGGDLLREPVIGHIPYIQRLVFVVWGCFIHPLFHFFMTEFHVLPNDIKWRPVRDPFKLFFPLQS